MKPKWLDFIILALIFLVFLGVFFCIINLHYSTIRDYLHLKAIETSGISVNAQVTDKHHSPSTHKNSLEYYTLDYTYFVDGKSYDKCKYVDLFIYNNAEVGNKIKVHYLPDNPGVSDIPGNYGLEPQWIQMIVFDFFIFLILLVLSIRYFYKKYKQRKKVEFNESNVLDDQEAR